MLCYEDATKKTPTTDVCEGKCCDDGCVDESHECHCKENADLKEIDNNKKSRECGSCTGPIRCDDDNECYENEHYLSVDTKLIHESKKTQKYNAPHHFSVFKANPADNTEFYGFEVAFQEGPIKEVGINGITNEDLLAMVAARLEGFQASEFASDDNATALNHVYAALDALNIRTKKRMARGVEGTNQQ